MPDDQTGLSNSMIAIDKDELQQVLNELAGKKKVVNEKNGELRSAIKAVVEEKGWHKGALADIRKIDAMSETARADYLRTFDPMMEVMYLGKWKDEMHGLDLGESSDADRED